MVPGTQLDALPSTFSLDDQQNSSHHNICRKEKFTHHNSEHAQWIISFSSYEFKANSCCLYE